MGGYLLFWKRRYFLSFLSLDASLKRKTPPITTVNETNRAVTVAQSIPVSYRATLKSLCILVTVGEGIVFLMGGQEIFYAAIRLETRRQPQRQAHKEKKE